MPAPASGRRSRRRRGRRRQRPRQLLGGRRHLSVRARSVRPGPRLSHAALDQYFATEAGGARHPADPGRRHRLDLAQLRRRPKPARHRRSRPSATPPRSVELTRARLQGGIAPRTDLRQAQTVLDQRPVGPRAAAHRARAGRERAAASGRRAGRSGFAARFDRGGATDRFAALPAGLDSGDPAAPPGRGPGRISIARRQCPDRRRARRLVPAHLAHRHRRPRQHRA